jgi:2-iminobutanoate/2-iminopropanoate deaminase
MQKIRITSEHVPEPPPELWSNCLVVGDSVYIAGLTARNWGEEASGGAYEQARRIFEKMSRLMTAAGGAMNDMVKLTIFVTDITQNTEVWRARKEFFTGDFPACSLVQVAALARPDISIEIEGFARLGCSSKD